MTFSGPFLEGNSSAGKKIRLKTGVPFQKEGIRVFSSCIELEGERQTFPRFMLATLRPAS